jgi:uncharacterized membrane protein
MTQPIIPRMPPKSRVEALSDGIFAVVMTVLVLDLKLPPNAAMRTNDELMTYFSSITHAFIVYVLSFIVLIMYWVAHNYQFHYVRRLDRELFWINLAFLLLTTTIPFTTNLVTTHPDLSAAVCLYAANILLLAIMLLLHLRRMGRHPELVTAEFAHLPRDGSQRRLLALCSVPVLAIIVAQFSPHWGLRMFYLLAALHFLLPHNASVEERA